MTIVIYITINLRVFHFADVCLLFCLFQVQHKKMSSIIPLTFHLFCSPAIRLIFWEQPLAHMQLLSMIPGHQWDDSTRGDGLPK